MERLGCRWSDTLQVPCNLCRRVENVHKRRLALEKLNVSGVGEGNTQMRTKTTLSPRMGSMWADNAASR